jgi:adenylate cyclase
VAIEIERKFLVKGEAWKKLGEGVLYLQGYLNSDKNRTVRVRIAGEKAYLTIKGCSINASRAEFEYEIPFEEASEMLKTLCELPLIEKHRYKIKHHGLVWEVDVFHGENEGLVVAEVELQNENQEILIPDWIGREVTTDKRYFNSSLIKNPYIKWEDRSEG